MEFVLYSLGGVMDLIIFIIILILSPFIKVIDSKKLNDFVKEILTKILSKEGLLTKTVFYFSRKLHALL